MGTFYAPWMRNINLEIKDNQQSETKEQKEKREIKERIEAIDYLLKNNSLLGAETIKERIDLEERLKGLTKEERYRKWFDENKKTIEKLFSTMADKFINHGFGHITFIENNGGITMTSGEFTMDKEFTIELLERYGYVVKKEFGMFGNKIINIYLK